jgi:hypothetical protein
MMLDNHLPIQTHPLGRVDRRPEFIVERPVVVMKADLADDRDAPAVIRTCAPLRL